MILYKLTDQNWETHNNTKWGPGVTHFGTGEGRLCGPGWIHAYTSPELAVLLNPIHADFDDPILWEAEGEIVKNDKGLKVGCRSLTTIKIIPLPNISIEQKIAFGILCALQVTKDIEYIVWAHKWLNNEDRTTVAYATAADAAATAVNATAYAAYATAYTAKHAARHAAAAADAAAATAYTAYTAYAADVAVYTAAEHAKHTAYATAANAAKHATSTPLDFPSIIAKALKIS